MGMLLLILWLTLPVNILAQNRSGDNSAPVTIPDVLRRPMRNEAPRYPRDLVIGELGQGLAPERAWLYAREIATTLLARNQSNSSVLRADNEVLREYFPVLGSFEPRKFHLGGGRIEVDGSVSFLVRFIGREQWLAGELYLRSEGNNWRLDDIVLEDVRKMEDGRSSYTYNFSPYERFF